VGAARTGKTQPAVFEAFLVIASLRKNFSREVSLLSIAQQGRIVTAIVEPLLEVTGWPRAQNDCGDGSTLRSLRSLACWAPTRAIPEHPEGARSHFTECPHPPQQGSRRGPCVSPARRAAGGCFGPGSGPRWGRSRTAGPAPRSG